MLYSKARIALMREIEMHPKLCSTLGGAGWEEIVGHTAAYVGVPIDAAFNPQQLEDLYDHLWKLLRSKRTEIIFI